MKVLKRFYKKIELVDASTNVDDDPVVLEKQRLERFIEHMRNERDDDMRKIQ